MEWRRAILSGILFLGLATAQVDLGRDLIVAAVDGNSAQVQELLKAGANVNTSGAAGTTALIEAALNGHLEVVNLLLGAGAEVNRKDAQGRSALWAAVYAGQNEVLSKLLEAKAEVNVIAAGYPALYWAVANRNYQATELLLKAGANPNNATPAGVTPLM